MGTSLDMKRELTDRQKKSLERAVAELKKLPPSPLDAVFSTKEIDEISELLIDYFKVLRGAEGLSLQARRYLFARMADIDLLKRGTE